MESKEIASLIISASAFVVSLVTLFLTQYKNIGPEKNDWEPFKMVRAKT